MVDNKRKKHHDKDKYYRLAKEQGLRSRAAFKLAQINRKFGFLEKCQSSVLDLCAAPGGWTQIAARTCTGGSAEEPVHIVAVDILPIRKLHAPNNKTEITTLIGDITTEKCKNDISRALSGATVDVVLHDGAPNVGADYGKDAYEQNEMAVHAVKVAVSHLREGGTLVTKLYRSRDYASYNWLLQQLFDSVQAYKPAASRQQSAEIFLIAEDYKAPARVDARLLDPKHIFEHVDGDTTTSSAGGGTSTSTTAAGLWKQLEKSQQKPNQRKRGGYDMDHLDATMRHTVPVADFVMAGETGDASSDKGNKKSGFSKEAIQILVQSTGLSFDCEKCRKNKKVSSSSPSTCHCQVLYHHPLTTEEIKSCCSDLQVLNKADFKGLLTWRSKMLTVLAERRDQFQEVLQGQNEKQSEQESADGDDSNDDGSGSGSSSEEDEEEIQAEISAMRERRQKEKKRQEKKKRAAASKRRRRAALGMDLNAIDVQDQGHFFSLASITSKRQLDAAAEVNLDQATDKEIFGRDPDDDNDDDVYMGDRDDDSASGSDEEEDGLKNKKRERDLDEAYAMYLQNTKNTGAVSGTKQAKRSKKKHRLTVTQEAEEDLEMAAIEDVDKDTQTYARMLQGSREDDSGDDGSDDESSDDDDGFHAEPMTPEEHAQRAQRATEKKNKKVKRGEVSVKSDNKNPLLHQFAQDESTSTKTARWFSNPLFESIGKKAAVSSLTNTSGSKNIENNNDSESDGDASNEERREKGHSSDAEDEQTNKRSKSKGNNKKVGLNADDVLAMMPKTDKQVRHEKRLKQMARDERKKSKRAASNEKLGLQNVGSFEVVGVDGKKIRKDGEDNDDKLQHMTEAQRKKVLEARRLIKAGMGKSLDADDNSAIEVVTATDTASPPLLPVMDDRKYDSDHEDYDSDDYAQTLALGTMMLRRSKEKALVDASYNRFAWNDPADLPEWFVDDEHKHYRPQLPIPEALIAKMKEKMVALSTKPIAKVAEARARKNKRKRDKLAAARRKAQAVANSEDMSEAMKLKAISKALRVNANDKKSSGKKYVVAKKGRGMQGTKGARVVDKRLKSDKRAMDRKEKKRKKGKQGGLTGSKKRRNHS